MDPEMRKPGEMTFSVLGSSAPVLAPRVGKLAIAGRKSLSTPHYIPLTSRGTVPHIAHDMLRKGTAINSLYAGLEDCAYRMIPGTSATCLQSSRLTYHALGPRSVIERKHPAPIYNTPVEPHQSPLRRFICAADDMPVILGPRRYPPIPCPPTNTETSIAILTSIGFRQLSAEHYVEAIQKLKPDIAIGLADIVHGKPPGIKRRGKMVDRTHAFTRDALEQLYEVSEGEGEKSRAAYFAPVLPLDNAQQSLYLDDLETEFRDYLSGLALYESSSLTFIPESLGDLPRFLLSDPPNPHELLRDISLGADLLTLPFIGSFSDAGIAFNFSFPAPSSSSESGGPHPLGIDLWSSEYKTDVSALREGCDCYACRYHHRAYFNHLLAAKEMTAWVLLSIHNHHIIDKFFAGVRESIQRGTFEADVQTFNHAYVSDLPVPTGEGPRLRGYQLPAAGAFQPRRMPRMYGRLDDVSQKFAESQSSLATPDTDADGLEKHGFAEKV